MIKQDTQYVFDWKKINTLKDIKRVLKGLQLSVTTNCTESMVVAITLEDLLIEFDKDKNNE